MMTRAQPRDGSAQLRWNDDTDAAGRAM